MKKPIVLDIAWAAGLFEGEGSIGVRRSKNACRLRLQIAMVDEDILHRFAGILGGKVYGPYKQSQRRLDGDPRQPFYRWTLEGKAAEDALAFLLPHLGQRRSARALEMLQQLTEPPPRKRNEKGQWA